MNSKNIKRHLNAKINDWIKSVKDEDVKKAIKENVIVTGGAMVSLLTGEEVNDYDVYFRNIESLKIVVRYYVDQWNKTHNKEISMKDDDGKVKIFIRSSGIVEEAEIPEEETGPEEIQADSTETAEEKPKYRPRFMTSNAITLSNKIQVVTRFYGEVEDIHKNYDFSHCTCAWSSWDNEVFLPVKALECIINKELYYVGSKYPLCSIIRTRKYIERGYHIDAGQYVKMAMQLNELELTNIETLEDQLTGVDTTYFRMLITKIQKAKEENAGLTIDGSYVIELVNKLF